MTYYHTVEVNTGAVRYYPGDSGTGTGSLNAFTIASPNWVYGDLSERYNLIDSAGSIFKIISNTTDTLSVSGTPASGAYTILPIITGFVGGTTVVIDAEKIDADWTNAVLSIQRPVSKSTQTAVLNNGNSYTYDSTTRGIITNTTGAFDTTLKQGDVLKIGGHDYVLQMTPVGNTAFINPVPEPPASGTLTAYKTQKDYGINLKKIIHNITIDGWITNDYVHHKDFSEPQYAEEKADALHEICGANAGNPHFANLALRENSFLANKFMRFAKRDVGLGSGTLNTLTDDKKEWVDDEWIGFKLKDSTGVVFDVTDNDDIHLTVVGTPANGSYTLESAVTGCLACTKLKIVDSAKECAPVRGGGGTTQRTDKMRVTLSFRYQDPK